MIIRRSVTPTQFLEAMGSVRRRDGNSRRKVQNVREDSSAISHCARKRIEEVFGWMKTVGGLRKLRHRGGGRVNWQFLLAAAAY